MDNKVEVKLSKKSLYGIIGIILLISIIIFSAIFLSVKKDTKTYNGNSLSKYNTSNDNSSYSSSNYFDSLKISNVSIIRTKYEGWNSVIGEVRNDSNKILSGYLEVSFYSSSGQLIGVAQAPFGSLSPGKTGTFETPGIKQNASSCKVLSGTISAN